MIDSGTGRADDRSCPRCGQRGTEVSATIVRIIATPHAMAEGVPQVPLFCRTSDCPVVYFERGGEKIISTGSVGVPVFSKCPDDEATPVCYCFGHSVGGIRERAAGGQLVSDDIRELVRAGKCACELRNPKESCCLGDVMQVERAAPGPVGKGCDVEEETCCV